MRIRKKTKSAFKLKVQRIIALFIAINMLFQIIAPTCAFALTGGPSQPEVQSFEPVGTSEMVDPFSGDFNYNIPLMDVDGYPINISYHSGITMDQEASWVGLGWNINPGVINRGMRGIPDDFNGENIVKELNMKPNITFGVNTSAGLEVFGFGKLGIGMGVRYNNYNGVGIEQSLNISISTKSGAAAQGTAGLGLTSSSDDGLSVNPSLSFSYKVSGEASTETKLGASVGASFNSRGGLKALTIGTSVSSGVKTSSKNDKGEVTGDKDDKASYGGGKSATFDFGMPTYTPIAGPSMQNFSMTGSFKLGFEAVGAHPNFTIGGYYSAQKLSSNIITNPAYGYMNADEGTKNPSALLDFNREKEWSFTPETPALPIPNFTYDIYSVSGQGVGGSYRPFRSDLGHVFDPYTSTTSDGGSVGAEIGVGNLTHFGTDLSMTNVNSESGRWSDDNPAATNLTHKASTGDPLYEKFYFKEANEKSVDADPDFLNIAAGGSGAQCVYLNQLSKFHTVGDHYYSSNGYNAGGGIPNDNYRKKRERRSQPLTIITKGELGNYGLEVEPGIYNNAPDHHIAEVTTLRNDGARYVYGLAAYNKTQEEVTFAVGDDVNGSGGHFGDINTGLVSYSPGVDNSINNKLGRDNYFSNTIMPAYAHSYLLTAVLSPDYVDSDPIKGPSDGDIGNFTKFNYDTKIEDYNWRVPVGENTATFNEGIKSDPTDNKANYIYGVKDLYYLTSIETKNYVAIFSLEERKDGYGVVNKNGKRASSKPMKLLNKISLYAKRAWNQNSSTAVPIKEVHFEYDYSLCPDIPNNINYGTTTDNGKLTLKKIYFTYQNSNKARLSPYLFKYSTFNPEYNIKGYDRWGNYKPNNVSSSDALSQNIPSAEYPYVDQNKITADQYTQAWSLNEIFLPSGGKIKVDYESDDYAYVQNKQAGQMFKIVDIKTDTDASVPSVNTTGSIKSMVDCYKLYFQLQDNITDITKYVNGIDNLYFRFLMNIRDHKYEYVSSYGQIVDKGYDAASGLGWIKLGSVSLKDNGGTSVNPIVKAAIQFGRLNMSRVVWSGIDESQMQGGFGKDLLVALINSDFLKNIGDAIKGPNEALYTKYNVGKSAVMGKSWIRLNNPNKQKLGGGCRVKKIAISDQWDGTGITTTTNSPLAFDYGQEYTYTLEDGTSSGVASYEPQLGGDENSWKQPIPYDYKKKWAPDDKHYLEEPFGESFFPSPGVGYSRVTVKNIQRANVTHNATGCVVHEFYTAKDFPTIAERTNLNAIREKTNPLSLSSLFKLKVRDYMTASQGYMIELNDMHGKPKKQEVYQEGQTTPITSVEYRYKSSTYLNDCSRLNNQATVLYSNGTVDDDANIGVFFDFVSDMREQSTTTLGASANLNVDGFYIPPAFLVYIPIMIPSLTSEKTRFRSAVITKVIQRFGILEETIAKDLGSTVATKNLAYDAETGDVLLKETTTDFNDKVYSLTYPAYWYYNAMGPAYKNVGFKEGGVTFSGGSAPLSNALAHFAEGDELALYDVNNPINIIKGWVLEVNANSIQVVNRDGATIAGTFNLKVLRSGRRNQQGVPMASITSLSNPLNNIQSNIYDNVLQAQAMEYTNGWKTFCDCFQGGRGTPTSNPYILGTKGMYKNKKSYLYLAGRTQSNYDDNTNIRKDGVFSAYSPFYKMDAGNWDIDSRNWTYTSEVTEFSPFGAELENKDALGRYSAATYGYNQTLPTAVAANSKYSAVGFDNFEDYALNACADNHFKFRGNTVIIDASQSHSGSKSIKVSSGVPLNMTKQLKPCTDIISCDIQLVPPPKGSQYCYTFTGGTAPYNFDWTIPGCDLAVSLSDSGNGICVDKPNGTMGTCYIKLTVTDKNNCKKIFNIEVTNATSKAL